MNEFSEPTVLSFGDNVAWKSCPLAFRGHLADFPRYDLRLPPALDRGSSTIVLDKVRAFRVRLTHVMLLSNILANA